jgi:opacity protein-like surface antigen
MRTSVILMAAAALIAATPAYAQYDKKLTINLGGGVTVPVSDVKERFGTGFDIAAGVTYHLTEIFGVQAEYTYHNLDDTARTIEVQLSPDNPITRRVFVEASHSVHNLDFSGVYKPVSDGPIGGYVLGGFGVYYRSVNLTTPGTGYTTICDPWWYVCYPALVPVDYLIGSRWAWDPGFDVGAGITYRVGEYAEVYAEARYHYIMGNQYTLPNGTKVKANGQYFPITFGFRF